MTLSVVGLRIKSAVVEADPNDTSRHAAGPRNDGGNRAIVDLKGVDLSAGQRWVRSAQLAGAPRHSRAGRTSFMTKSFWLNYCCDQPKSNTEERYAEKRVTALRNQIKSLGR